MNHELFGAVVTWVLVGLTLDEVADAMRAGWPELGVEEVNAEGYIERQGDLDRAYLRRRLANIGEYPSGPDTPGQALQPAAAASELGRDAPVQERYLAIAYARA